MVSSEGQVGKITLLCTQHREFGRCTEDELLRILESIDPDVIFEEIRPSDIDAHDQKRLSQTLEMRAVSRYQECRPVRRVPVDDYEDITQDFHAESTSMFEYVASNSREYRALLNVENQEIFHYGYLYLNSTEWEALNRKIETIMEQTVTQSGDADLQQFFSNWKDRVRNRTTSMVENIYAFARINPFTNGVFLVGAAHKSNVVAEITNRPPADAALVDWNIG